MHSYSFESKNRLVFITHGDTQKREKERFDGKMSRENSTTEPKNGPNIWRNVGADNNNPDTDQSNAQRNQSPPESDLESEERLAQIFKRLDGNGNGRIDIQELTGALKGSGMPHQYAEVSQLSIEQQTKNIIVLKTKRK